jgi:hypothetical protein
MSERGRLDEHFREHLPYCTLHGGQGPVSDLDALDRRAKD